MSMNSATTLRRPTGFSLFANLGRAAIEKLELWHSSARSRRELASLDDRILRDIGLTRSDVERECRKPFWRT